MAVRSKYLADKSALARMHLEPVRAVLVPLLTLGGLATCAVVDLEVLYSARSPTDYESVLNHRQHNYTNLPITPQIGARAIEVQSELAQSSRHRGCSVSDLLIAACAEAYGVPVLHYDHDFELVASITGQAMRWVVPQGSVP